METKQQFTNMMIKDNDDVNQPILLALLNFLSCDFTTSANVTFEMISPKISSEKAIKSVI
jgi:hypothetical protein